MLIFTPIGGTHRTKKVRCNMADIELVIRIPQFIYKQILKGHVGKMTIAHIFKKATPLPKGHGNLIDTNEITAFRELECNGHDVESLNEFTVIIEADKGEQT